VTRATGPGLDSGHPLVADALALLGMDSEAERPIEVLPMDRRKADPGTVRASQRWRLLLAAAHVIATEGYAAATIEKIVTEAGVSKKTFYTFFASKEAAFLACYDGIDSALEHFAELAREERDLDQAVDTVAASYLAVLVALPDLTRLLLIEALAATPRIRLRRTENLEKFATAFQRTLEELGGHDSRVGEHSTDDIIALLGGLNELCVRHISRHEVETLPSIGPQLTSFFRNHMGLPPRPGESH